MQSSEKKVGIYRIRNLTTNKVYIGQSNDIDRRWYHHKYYLNKGTHENSFLQNAWNKYGESDFEFMILETCENNYETLNELEVKYIALYDSLNRSKGYNLASGGGNSNSLARFTEEQYKEHCKKISECKKEYYKTHTHINKGKAMSDEQKKKLSQVKKGTRLGIKRPEHSEAMVGSNNPRALKVRCVETGEVFNCAKDAASKYKVTNSTILKTCKGIQATSAGKHWEYV